MLNSDQEKALKEISRWWKGNQRFYILDGRGGTGKSFLINEILQTLSNVSPIIICPTNEALKQVRDKVTGDYMFKTAHSALGLAPTKHKSELTFEQLSIPKFWDNINLAICDEASMYSKEIQNYIEAVGCKILYVGHKAQLPEVKINRSIFDKCVSSVFDCDYPTSTLNIPMRNTGLLWDFNNYLEECIYSGNRFIPNTFDIKKETLREYTNSDIGKKEIFTELTKIVLWTNDGVDRINDKFRQSYFGVDAAKNNRYLPGDKIILTAPLLCIEHLEHHTEAGLRSVANKDKDRFSYLYSNSKAEVIYCTGVIVKLNKELSIPCYKIDVKCEGEKHTFYEPIYLADFKKMSDFYERLAWKEVRKENKNNAFKFKHFILSCFAKVKHYYAATSHRLQGASIENVIVYNSDISKNMCLVEQMKCRYVATSRAKEKLMFYRGG